MGHLTNQGLTARFYGFISGHSSFELIGGVLSGAGGLRMGLGLMHPGRRSRMGALKEGARKGARLLFGAAVLTFVAACFEGFWSGNTVVPWKAKVAVGLAFWILLGLWLLLAGRRTDEARDHGLCAAHPAGDGGRGSGPEPAADALAAGRGVWVLQMRSCWACSCPFCGGHRCGACWASGG